MRKFIVIALMLIMIGSSYGGYSSGRSGGFGGGRSFSSGGGFRSSGYSSRTSGFSSSSVKSYSPSRPASSGFAPNSYRPTYTGQATSRTYSSTPSPQKTVINNHHYGSSGGGGNGFMSGFMGGWLGGMMSHPFGYGGGVMPVAAGPVVGGGYVDGIGGGVVPVSGYGGGYSVLGFLLSLFILFLMSIIFVKFIWWLFKD